MDDTVSDLEVIVGFGSQVPVQSRVSTKNSYRDEGLDDILSVFFYPRLRLTVLTGGNGVLRSWHA